MPEIFQSLVVWLLVTQLLGFIIQPFRSPVRQNMDREDFETEDPLQHSDKLSYFALACQTLCFVGFFALHFFQLENISNVIVVNSFEMQGLQLVKNMCKTEKVLRIMAALAYLLIKNSILAILIKITEPTLEVK